MGTAYVGFDTDVRFTTGSEITSGTDGDLITSVTNVTLSPTNETLDSTAFGDGAFQRIKGLQDVEISIEGNVDYPEASAGSQDKLEQAFLDRASGSVGLFPRGSNQNGYEFIGYITEYEISSEVDGIDEFTVTLAVSDGNKLDKVT